MNGHSRHLTPERLAEIQARIKASCPTRTITQETPADRTARGPDIVPRATKRWYPPKGSLTERSVLAECAKILDKHPRVSLFWRQNTGAMRREGGQYVKFSFVGASDLMGMSTSGRFIAVECKREGVNKPTPAQQSFLDNVADGGGFAICVDHPAKLMEALKAL